jgi:hypothetical protein
MGATAIDQQFVQLPSAIFGAGTVGRAAAPAIHELRSLNCGSRAIATASAISRLLRWIFVAWLWDVVRPYACCGPVRELVIVVSQALHDCLRADFTHHQRQRPHVSSSLAPVLRVAYAAGGHGFSSASSFRSVRHEMDCFKRGMPSIRQSVQNGQFLCGPAEKPARCLVGSHADK